MFLKIRNCPLYTGRVSEHSTFSSNDNRFQKPPWPTPDSRWHPDRSWADHSPGLTKSRQNCLESSPPWCLLVCSWGSSYGWISHRRQGGGESHHKSGRRGSSGLFLHSPLQETRDIQANAQRCSWCIFHYNPQSLVSYGITHHHQLMHKWVIRTTKQCEHRPNRDSGVESCGGVMGTQVNYWYFVHWTYISKLHL